MAVRRPLVLVNGDVQELPTSDTVVGASSGSAVPLTVAAGEVYTVPDNTQALFAIPLDVDGDVVVDGELVEVA